MKKHGLRIEERNLKSIKDSCMNFKPYFLAFLFISGNLFAKYPIQDKENPIIQKMSSHLEMMRHEINNHDADIKTLESKLINLEDAVENLRSLYDDALNKQKEKSKNTESIDSKLSSQQQFYKNLVTDIQSLQLCIEEIQKSHQSQNKEIDQVKKALKSLMTALNLNDFNATKDESYRTYKVQPGDSLGLIAQKHGVKVKEIKELNHLKNDVIIQGQTLKIPN